MAKKKFFIVTTIANSLGFFRGQLKMLEKTFDVCAIASMPDLLKRYGETEGIGTHCIPMKRPISFFWDIWCLLCFIIFFLRERPYIVHGNTPKGGMLSMVAAWFTRCPVRIYMCHGLRYQGAEGRLRKLLILMERLSCACATDVLCVSHGVVDTLVKDRICSAAKARVIGYGSANGINLERFDPESVDGTRIRRELGILDADFVFCFVGRILKDKGVDELITAFHRLSEEYGHIHLLLVGPHENDQNPVSDETLRLMESNKCIYVLGRQSDIRPYVKASNAFVLGSYREGFGMVLIEAGALGVPGITTNIIGCNEIIVPGKNGDIVEPRNTEQLYGKMKEWVLHPEKVAAMAVNARRMVKDRFEQSQVWALYLEEYKKLVGEEF